MVANRLNILVVEDDNFQRKMIVKMLHALNVLSVNDVDNGRSALEIIRKQSETPVDIVICDLNMPEMDGLEFLRHLGEKQYNISVIIISALDSKLVLSAGKMTRMYGAKLLGAIEKPIYLEHLKDLFLKYERFENKWFPSTESINFSLDEMKQGIRNKQFETFLQPKIDLQTSRVTGAEALARWIHPVHGVIGPHIFIPLLEKNNQIDELSFLILDKAAAACRLLHNNNCKITVSVNLSLVSLDDITLANKISKIVKAADVDPSYITLEITETAAMTGAAHALENLTRLCMNGFKLSIDDYGTGYSSLQQLTRIAFSELKIDQSFIQDSVNNEAARIVIKSSIDMARELKVQSVAEGVETQQDWDMLKDMGCNTAQGYFIAKPMNLPSFIDYCVEKKQKY
ncbi:EAL domain-containing response regulator [Nitrosomonas supralitoralis]|uniref:Diguanylate phosphodiesterase n=1 Tax=Nitrosomonas supralitoralis TaxID=2116706 RepID=A0A2P7NRB2_9PROT|nr:EAL domain-containing response regulator [Nitrosomonas supralitoralis]PSJ16012.1 diguanylate phosphodiesterase [Nitrosomonas supralitoralis]